VQVRICGFAIIQPTGRDCSRHYKLFMPYVESLRPHGQQGLFNTTLGPPYLILRFPDWIDHVFAAERQVTSSACVMNRSEADLQ
jgi:hypothetical protein